MLCYFSNAELLAQTKVAEERLALTWAGGESNPVVFDQYIRNTELGAGITKNVQSGKAP